MTTAQRFRSIRRHCASTRARSENVSDRVRRSALTRRWGDAGRAIEEPLDIEHRGIGVPTGSSPGANSNSAAPKPTTAVLLILARAAWCLRRVGGRIVSPSNSSTRDTCQQRTVKTWRQSRRLTVSVARPTRLFEIEKPFWPTGVPAQEGRPCPRYRLATIFCCAATHRKCSKIHC